MGRPKQLLPVSGTPAIRRCLETILAAGVRDVVAVLGADSGEVEAACAGLPVRFAYNRVPGSDMAESVRCGLRAIDGAATGILVCLCDYPLVTSRTVGDLMEEHVHSPDRIIAVLFEKRRGHPTLFPRSIIGDIYEEGLTLRDVLERHAHLIRFIAVDDEGVVQDMDTPEDYERILRVAAGGQGSVK